MILKPMLAATIESPEDLDSIEYPVYVSPKLDGVRCLTFNGPEPYSRKGEPFQNKMLETIFAQAMVPGYLDGELGVGSPTDKKFFTITSGACRRDGYIPVGGFTYYVFDRISELSFATRISVIDLPKDTPDIRFVKVPQELCTCKAQVLAWEQKWVLEGYEGIMIRGRVRDVAVGYKHGRSSLNSQELMKYKRFADAEGTIIGFEEGKTNTNEAKKDALGHTKRSSAKAGKVANGRVGTLIVRSLDFAEDVRIGTGIGLTQELRTHMWENQHEYIGKTVTFCFQAGSDYIKARFPSFKGFRDDGI